MLSGEIEKNLSGIAPVALTRLFLSETLIGALIGFLARIFFGALETLGGSHCDVYRSDLARSRVRSRKTNPLPAISTLITLTAMALIFFTDLHWEVLRGLGASYSALPVSGLFDARFDLVQVSDCLTKSFLVSLRISSPFIVYALIINFVIGLAGKLAPQIPLYFITVPAVSCGGIVAVLRILRAIPANF